jgi:alkylation response protein AidB-like acyl-CoA dehydrogenase
MHLAYLTNVVRIWERAVASGDGRREAALAATMERIARERLVFAAAGSEVGQDLTHPAATAERTDDGWLVSGRKVFCTMSPAADVFYVAVAFEGRYGYAMVPRDAPGVEVHDDWDAMGMRASGSNSVTFEGVRIPRSALGGGFPVGDAHAYMERNLAAGLFHAAAALGIAESAAELATARLAGRNGGLDARSRVLVAENAVDLSAARAVFGRAAGLVDDRTDADGVAELFAEAQGAKAFVGDAATRIVDRALALSGGAGYLNGSPLARAYRDARATAFMHPLGANRAYELLGDVALGREPALR